MIFFSSYECSCLYFNNKKKRIFNIFLRKGICMLKLTTKDVSPKNFLYTTFTRVVLIEAYLKRHTVNDNKKNNEKRKRTRKKILKNSFLLIILLVLYFRLLIRHLFSYTYTKLILGLFTIKKK